MANCIKKPATPQNNIKLLNGLSLNNDLYILTSLSFERETSSAFSYGIGILNAYNIEFSNFYGSPFTRYYIKSENRSNFYLEASYSIGKEKRSDNNQIMSFSDEQNIIKYWNHIPKVSFGFIVWSKNKKIAIEGKYGIGVVYNKSIDYSKQNFLLKELQFGLTIKI